MVYCDYVEESVVSQPMNGESEPYRHSKNRGSRLGGHQNCGHVIIHTICLRHYLTSRHITVQIRGR